MVYFSLQLRSNDTTFKYTFSEEFLNGKYEIGLIEINFAVVIK
jgi:hypothetical protein